MALDYAVIGTTGQLVEWVCAVTGLDPVNASHVVAAGIERDVFEPVRGLYGVPDWVGPDELFLLANPSALPPLR